MILLHLKCAATVVFEVLGFDGATLQLRHLVTDEKTEKTKQQCRESGYVPLDAAAWQALPASKRPYETDMLQRYQQRWHSA